MRIELLLRDVALILAVGPFIYYLLAPLSSAVYFRSASRKVASESYQSPASILKPVRGLDHGAYENFASFCLIDYPRYEIFFCVNSPADPAVPVIERLCHDFPERDVRLLIGAPHLGPNGKVNNVGLPAKLDVQGLRV